MRALPRVAASFVHCCPSHPSRRMSPASPDERTFMRARTWAAATVLLASTLALAQDAPKPEQLKKMYDDALAQLKAAQDRKTELAQQNEKLTAQIAEMTKELDRLRNEAVDLKRRDAETAERTFFLRSQYAAWN